MAVNDSKIYTGAECANFVSQCLIAESLDLSAGSVDDRGGIICCAKLHDFLVNNIGATCATRWREGLTWKSYRPSAGKLNFFFRNILAVPGRSMDRLISTSRTTVPGGA
jgi:hypothetical protein